MNAGARRRENGCMDFVVIVIIPLNTELTMKELNYVELPDLYDLLAQQTNRYMKMLSDGATRLEFNQCREIIIDIQAEIQSRKNQKARDKANPDTSLKSTYNSKPKN